MRKENREKLRENRVGAGERQNRRASQHCFQRALASTTETAEQKRHFQNKFAFFQTLSRLFHFAENVKLQLLVYTLRLVNCDNLLQHLRHSIVFSSAESKKICQACETPPFLTF